MTSVLDESSADTHTAEASAEAQVRSGTVPGEGGAALEAGGVGLSEAAGGQRIDRLIGPVGRGTELEPPAVHLLKTQLLSEHWTLCLGRD